MTDSGVTAEQVERVAEALKRTDDEGFSPEIEQILMDDLPAILDLAMRKLDPALAIPNDEGTRITPEWCLKMAELEAGHEIGAGRLDHPLRSPPLACEIPPPGWWCSRAPGHEGPCAARPIESERHSQARWFAGNVVAAGPDLPSRQKWTGLYRLAVQLEEFCNEDKALAATPSPVEDDEGVRSEKLKRAFDRVAWATGWLREAAATLKDECQVDGDWEVWKEAAERDLETAELIETLAALAATPSPVEDDEMIERVVLSEDQLTEILSGRITSACAPLGEWHARQCAKAILDATPAPVEMLGYAEFVGPEPVEDDEMIERVARALVVDDFGEFEPGKLDEWMSKPDFAKSYRKNARAAIAATKGDA